MLNSQVQNELLQ